MDGIVLILILLFVIKSKNTNLEPSNNEIRHKSCKISRDVI